VTGFDLDLSGVGPLPDLLSVVVPAHEMSDRLVALLQSLDGQARRLNSGPLPVVVSDDGSSRPIATSLMERFPGLDLKHIRSNINSGPGAARNRGLDEISSQWVAFLDSDTVPRDQWLRLLVARISQEDTADGLEGRIAVPGEASPFTHATTIDASQGQHGGANIAYRTEVILGVGGFSEAFYDPTRKMHFREDNELRFRMAKQDIAVAFEPDIVVDHPPLPRSIWSPVRLARRYYFDPLLSSLYPEQFLQMNKMRSRMGYSMRRARHHASLALVLGLVVSAIGVAMDSKLLLWVGIPSSTAGFIGNLVALGWSRKVRPSDLPAMAFVATLVPFVYLYHYYRGVIRFRHFARM